MALIRDRRKFRLGLAGLAGFAVVLAAWVRPLADGRSGLRWADDLFNQLCKDSADYSAQLCLQAPRFAERRFQVVFTAPSPPAAEKMARLAAAAGATAQAQGARVDMEGRLGPFAAALLEDADLLFRNKDRLLEERRGMSARETVYWWWMMAEPIYKHYIATGDVGASNFVSALRTRACEPAYNFAGIEPKPVAQAVAPLALLLSFYLVYTVWYGFSILFVCEGLGIVARKRKKEE